VIAGTGGNHVNASIGVSMFPQDGKDSETLIKHADVAMYAAKAAGKGWYQFYQAHLSDSLILKLNKEAALRKAIECDEFVLHYQPRVSTYTGTLSSIEALVRWNHLERGLIMPLEFIDTAEDTGLILRLGEIVIEKACAQLAQWQLQHLAVVPISINVSGLQIKEGKVSALLAQGMERHRIDPSLIEIELTESTMIGNEKAVSDELQAIRSLGVKLLIDDFGTGHSSLAQLQRLDVDILKVDRAFTKSLDDGAEGEALFKAIVSMAGALDMGVVAEGVETTEQLRVLQSLSCDEIQGHLVSKPLPANEMASLMLKRIFFSPASPPSQIVTT
jgi:EAL domain-containing protein (putative c-di-GMP-specific phosphodiesterase class I)